MVFYKTCFTRYFHYNSSAFIRTDRICDSVGNEPDTFMDTYQLEFVVTWFVGIGLLLCLGFRLIIHGTVDESDIGDDHSMGNLVVTWEPSRSHQSVVGSTCWFRSYVDTYGLRSDQQCVRSWFSLGDLGKSRGERRCVDIARL